MIINNSRKRKDDLHYCSSIPSQTNKYTLLLIFGNNKPKLYLCNSIKLGSGSSASIVADRLSAKGHTVLVIEAGKRSIGDLGGLDVVGTKGKLDPTSMEYTPERQVTIYDVPLYWQSSSITGGKWGYKGAGIAKLVGGCGVHNGMVFQRGLSSDYDSWNLPGWNWTTMSTYLKKLEKQLDPQLATSDLHGHDGKIKVGSIPFDKEGQQFLASCNASGLPFNSDFQQDFRDGCGYFHFNIDKTKGERSTPAHEYLLDAVNSKRVELLPEATVTRIRWRYDIPSRKYEATGVEFVLNKYKDKVFTVDASKEVILAAGTLNTPKILLQSGVGNSTYLNQYRDKIPMVVSNLPGVGRNLQNHFLFFSVYQYSDVNSRPTMYDLFSLDLAYKSQGAGIFGTPGYSVGVWLRGNSTKEKSAENVMIVQPGVIGTTTPFPSVSLGISIGKPEPNNHWLDLSTNQSGSKIDFFMRPPNINFTLLNNPLDVQKMVRGFKEAKRIMSFPPMSTLMTPAVPPPTATSDADLEAYIRANINAHEHWCGTSKMGLTSDPMSVVDPRLKVIGVRGVRVVDASVIPIIPDSLVHATVMAIAEKASDLILEDYPNQGSNPLDLNLSILA
ncbi:choline dehydrogenase [Heterostelium album PN500]|uniref:Choline dehydrogenase n=1 Tax=Heterostelium pallidum (strain ATCC 26659 / Pp 5 / PN500) TaxID=670386 RepID=D3BH57_HETP5|nr:choline dehydrogenase [Heterostelium album PN500]EFA79441.1 choline dehydrogenase [Heterostelium album PN500]|eukprot:XP_020431562.1 choline dehydrogenase [Heterostelium album PN500]